MFSKRNLVEKKAVLASLTEEKVVQVKGLVERKVLIEQRLLKGITLVMTKMMMKLRTLFYTWYAGRMGLPVWSLLH